jgi:uncharacterized integral membrane protein
MRSTTTPAKCIAAIWAGVVRAIVIAAIVVVFVVVALDNRQDVRLGYVFGDVSAPVWLVILGAGFVGLLVGWLIRHRPRS